jgi:predicted small lipoprotein YifL
MMERRKSVATPDRAAKRGTTQHAILMVMVIGLSGCGQKGPLTLGQPAPAALPASAATR